MLVYKLEVIFLIVMHFSTGSIAVGNQGKPVGYSMLSDCKKDIPSVIDRWQKLNYPMPDKITCEKLELKK